VAPHFVISTVGCPRTDFNLLSVARGYVTIASVMAGFAFAALMSILTASRGRLDAENERFSEAAQVLTVAFVGLLLSAVSYAVVTGERYNGPRTASEQVFAGTILANSAVLLVYAIVLTLEAAHPGEQTALGRAGKRMRTLAGSGIAPLALLYLVVGADDYTSITTGSGWIVRYGFALVGLDLLIAVALLFDRRRRARGASSMRPSAVGAFPRVALGAIAFGVIAIALVQILIERCEQTPPWTVVGSVSLVFVTMVAASWSFLAAPPSAVEQDAPAAYRVPAEAS
jgi:hypothetical protein